MVLYYNIIYRCQVYNCASGGVWCAKRNSKLCILSFIILSTDLFDSLYYGKLLTPPPFGALRATQNFLTPPYWGTASPKVSFLNTPLAWQFSWDFFCFVCLFVCFVLGVFCCCFLLLFVVCFFLFCFVFVFVLFCLVFLFFVLGYFLFVLFLFCTVLFYFVFFCFLCLFTC